MGGRQTVPEQCAARAGGRRGLGGVSMAALLLALLAPQPLLAQMAGSPAAAGRGQQGQQRSTPQSDVLPSFDLRGSRTSGERDITLDPRFIAPENPFQAPPRPVSGGPVPVLPGADADATQASSGGPVTRRSPSRASRPVQARIKGLAQRPVRPERRQIVGLPPGLTEAPRTGAGQPQESGQTSRAAPQIPDRRTLTTGALTSTRVVTPAADGLQDVQRRRPAQAEADPYAPLGLRVGTFVVTPSITQSVGHDSNPNRAPTGARGSVFSRTDGEVQVRSDWSRHSFTSTLRGGYSFYSDQRDASRPDATGTSNLRLNLSRDTDIDIEQRLSLETQRPGSTNFNAATRERPNVYGYGASAGVTQRFNRLSLNLRGSVDRTTYDDARDLLGGLIRQSARDVTQLGIRGRVGYELTPGVAPFVEVSTDTRVFDEKADPGGFRRGSVGSGARVGSTFELTRLLTGEVSVGYQQRSYDDPRLKELRGMVGDASLIWSATPLTTVTLRGSTELADTTVPNLSGTINRKVSLDVAHALRRNWTIGAFAEGARSSFGGGGATEDTISAGLRTEYRLTRTTSVRASFTHERLQSTAAGADYTANIFLVGLRLQL
jgi:hypothetical protein